MSVNHLARLLESGEYRRCLDEASALLQQGGQSAEAVTRIQAAICRSSLELSDYFAAVDAGRAAVAMAAEAGSPDLLGPALLDLATAHSQIRQYSEAVAVFEQFLEGLATYTAARCLEGTALQRLAETLASAGDPAEALARLCEARIWFERYGDAASAMECARAAMHVHLEQGELAEALPYLQAGARYAAARHGDREFRTNHLLDRALLYLATGQPEAAGAAAFAALEAAEGNLMAQSRAQLMLAHSALAQNKPHEAFSFALAARISAIDGRAYDIEFDASDILFRLLRERGERLLREVEADFYQQGVDIHHYLSRRVVARMTRAN
ncbi:MAG: hypothetical protein JWN15_2071 [Firmicutes bacterium]|nr:hypothetical protein [Bacillota bacterium]